MTYEQYAIFRNSKGMKDANVAELAGIGRSTFSDWKSGRSVPKTEKLDKIRSALGISIPDFYGMNLPTDLVVVSDLTLEKKDEAFAHGADDALLIKKYHKLSPANQAVIKSTLEALLAAQGSQE